MNIWPNDFEIWYRGPDINSKQLLLITFSHISHIKGGHFTLEKVFVFPTG
jgi:hypothetical protein